MISNRIKNLKMFYPVEKWEDNPILRAKSTPVTTFDDDLLEFADVLNELMFEYDGVGLAAPQIGKNIRMISITFRNVGKKDMTLRKSEIMINPELVYTGNAKDIDSEWCISLPWLECKVKRCKDIKVKYQDVLGNFKTISAKWFNARIILHEMDHLDGILMCDNAISKKCKDNIKNMIREL
mgnify:CR=1 FL=1